MAITYTKLVKQMVSIPVSDNLNDVVYGVTWDYIGTSGAIRHAVEIYTYVPSPTPESFTPYDQLTQSQVESWLEPATPPDVLADATRQIESYMTAAIPPNLEILPLPWG